ncbi:hypothetical protein GO013_11245 [Pseudodesulfovibrio sp. JC047]|uniref:phage tail length tape measure family protein n=1 Tax=Pseudodesulfovibrio sp. JC047 TaxID=2683199 RepID=UPI0013D6CFC3|nr:phage tail length tape measure family protein [Pseudodesulfovibrio sp. JC047]NDV19997.1 hypothetical protein [Pseudodesulfovibrio sp. JC047]
MAVIETQIKAINKSEREFKKLHKDLKKTQTEGRKATTVWDRFGKAGKGAANDVSKAMESASGKTGMFGATLGRLGPTGLAVGAAIGTMTAGLVSGTMEMAEWERRLGRTEALLKSTGYAAGLTASELDNLARERDLATLGDRNEIMDAINLMQTYKSVSGDTFRESITLAQDMSAVTGQSLTSATTMLGKALEDPIRGLTSMRRVGVSFTQTEEEVIKAMADANDIAGAQAKILEVLRGQFGGAAEGEAKNLLGTLDTLSYEWRDLKEAMSNTDAAMDGVNALIGVIRELQYAVKDTFGEFSGDEQVALLEASIANQKRLIEAMRDEAVELPVLDAWIGKSAHLDAAQEKLEELEGQLHRIEALQEGGEMRDMFVIKDQGKKAADSRASDYEIQEQIRKEEEAQKAKEAADKKAAAEKARLEKEAVRIAEAEIKAREKRLADYRLQLDEARLGKEYVKRQEIEAQYQQMLADGISQADADFWKGKEIEKLTDKVKDNVSQWKDAFGEFGDEAESVFGSVKNGLMDSLSTGNDLLDQLIGKLLDLGMAQIEGMVLGGHSAGGFDFFGTLGGFVSSIFHDGGVIGGSAPARIAPVDLFKGAPRFHGGGILGPREVPIIGKEGELILNAMQQKNVAGVIGGGATFVFNADISLPTPSGNRDQDSTYLDDAAKAMERQFDVWWSGKMRQAQRPGGQLNGGPRV